MSRYRALGLTIYVTIGQMYYAIMAHSGGDRCFMLIVHSIGLLSNLVLLWVFAPILAANPSVTQKGIQFVSCASREQTYM